VRVLTLVLALVLGVAVAHAQPTPVIEANRESEILALFAPHQLAREVTPGWKLWDIAVSPSSIDVECRGPDERRARFRLSHPSAASGEPTPSFVVVRDGTSDPAGNPAIDALVSAVKQNDKGGFFRVTALPRKPGAPAPTRFLFIPGLTLVLGLVGMLLSARRGGAAVLPR
jgi:hypothetical protein